MLMLTYYLAKNMLDTNQFVWRNIFMCTSITIITYDKSHGTKRLTYTV